MQSPIELPTKRHSFQNPKHAVDVNIHDPQWIPVLNPVVEPREHVEKELSPYNASSFSPFSDHSAPRPSQSHTYTKSSLAPESVPAANDTTGSPSLARDVPPLPPLPASPTKFELPAGRPTSEYFQYKPSNSPSREEIKDESTDTEGTTESCADQSTVGTASLLDEQTYSIPGQPLSAKDASPREDFAILPSLPLSTHSSFSSLRKAATPTGAVPIVPTSKYSRKPVPGRSSVASASPRVSSISPVPYEPAQPTQPLPARVSSASPTHQEQTHVLPPPPIPSPIIPSQKHSTALSKSPLSISVQASNSSASQRRQRALTSHPSSNSLASRRNSSSSDQDVPVIPAPAPQPRSRPSSHKTRKSTDSRMNRNPSFTSLAPTPAPTTPLPQLPSHALNFETESEGMPKTPQAAFIPNERESAPRSRGDHSQLASFMTTNQTMIFRRFDDVHVQLLLCLQDEISELERKLNELEGASMTRNDRTLERMQVIRELRRVVTEYGKLRVFHTCGNMLMIVSDQLFASWSSMQATKAPKSTIANLKQWLERPTTSAGAGLGRGAQEDLLWLDGAKDLSSVNLGLPTKAEKMEKERNGSVSSTLPNNKKKGGLFTSCAGKRK
jgi:hypothetical protein